jgi:phosphatidylserine decarboxylase
MRRSGVRFLFPAPSTCVSQQIASRFSKQTTKKLIPMSTLRDRLAVLPQYLLPKLWLTQLAGRLAQAEWGSFTRLIIERFIRRYQVDMSLAAEPNPAAYDSFNAFFTRALRPGARPLATTALVCPVDGAISQLGPIQNGQIVQAKGHHYSTIALLGGDASKAAAFAQGQFATIYLSPKDYHRIHMPLAARLLSMTHVPGDLFSVNPTTARGVPGLFARNERLVCWFESDSGPWVGTFALVLVGATIVGSMATVWHGVVNPPRPGQVRSWDYAQADIRLAQGEEMGRFLLGSTVVLLFPPGAPAFCADWSPTQTVRMGQAMSTH